MKRFRPLGVVAFAATCALCACDRREATGAGAEVSATPIAPATAHQGSGWDPPKPLPLDRMLGEFLDTACKAIGKECHAQGALHGDTVRLDLYAPVGILDGVEVTADDGSLATAATWLSDLPDGYTVTPFPGGGGRPSSVLVAGRAVLERRLAERRTEAAAGLDELLVSSGYEVEVSAQGVDRETLHIKSYLCGRVWVSQLLDGDVQARPIFAASGFTELVCTNGADTWRESL